MSALTDRLDEWAALAEAATPGPWHVDPVRAAVWTASPDTYLAATVAEMNDDPYFRGVKPDEDAAFIAASRTALPALVQALRAVLELHKPLDIKVVDDPVCIAEECDHAGGECPATGTLTICAGCDEMCERADPYYSESNIHVVAWPCPTIEAIATALGVTP